jgi:hypothetical protein
MEYNLFLDDNWTPVDMANRQDITLPNKTKYLKLDWIVVKTYEEFVKTIEEKGLPEIVSFDHDLSPEHYAFIYNDENWSKDDVDISINYSQFKSKTGWHAAKWLVKYCDKNRLDLPIPMVHSQNPIGKINLINLLF